MNSAEDALRALAADLVSELSAARALELTAQAHHDALVELSWPEWDIDLPRKPGMLRSGRPAPGSVPVQADPSGIAEWTAPPPGLCESPLCDHLTLRCPRNRTHLVGGHPGNRARLISAGSTRQPAGSAPARGQAGLTAGDEAGDEVGLAAVEVKAYERTTGQGRPQHVRGYRRGTGLEHPGDLARGGLPHPVSNLGSRWVEGLPGHFVNAISDPQWQAGQELWAGRGQAVSERRATPGHAATAFASRAGAVVPALLGGGHQAWNGKVRLFDAKDEPEHSAVLQWDGTMGLQRELAAKLRDELPGTGPIADPQPYVTVLHELIHGAMPAGQEHAMHARAYAGPAVARIEEGFTELGTIEHAPEFLTAMGVGGRPTPVIAVEDGHAADRHATMSEYAGRLADPERIAAGTAWGHYGWQTAAALAWVTGAAQATHGSARELADEINREGAGGKLAAMGRQAIRAAGAEPGELAGSPFTAVESVIENGWPAGPDGAQHSPWERAVAAAKALAWKPAPEGRTSGLMHVGDMQGEYQAIAQAPVSWSAGSAKREIGGHLVSGSWSDPWWMIRQGGGYAISRRWKSKAQTGFGGWDAASNRHTTVTIPAKDERVLTPWYPGTAPGGPGQDVADTQALYAAPGGGYTPERAALHEKIIRDALAGAEPSGHPVATFMGGGPASGKSAMLAVRPAQGVVIDPDEIKAQLPEYAALVKARDPTAAAYVHEESSDIAKEIQRHAIGRSVHFTLDGTGDSSYAKMARKVGAAKAAGYQVAARYVTVDTGKALERIIKRAERTGRLVPAAFARETHASVSEVFARAIADGLFDSAELWDNNAERGEGGIRLIGSKEPGGSWTVTDQAAWQRFLAKAYTGATEAQARAAETGKAAPVGAR